MGITNEEPGARESLVETAAAKQQEPIREAETTTTNQYLESNGKHDSQQAPSINPLTDAVIGRPLPRKFSEQAIKKLEVLPIQYWDDLVSSASRIARRNNSDVVSAADVEAADRNLQHRPRQVWWSVTSTAGGLLGGAGMGQLFQVLPDDNPSIQGLMFGIIPTVVGLVLIAVAIARTATS
jgi:hypothetical protein